MQKRIIDLLDKKPQSIDEIAKNLKIRESNDFINLTKEVNKLIEENKCFEEKGIIYSLNNYAIGTVDIYKDKAYVENKEIKCGNNFLFDGDKIVYKENKHEAMLIKIIERNITYVYGTTLIRKNKLYFFSDDIRLKNFKVTNFKDFKLKPFYKVRTYISDYNKKLLKIDKVIGKIDDEETLIDTILLKNDAPKPFSNKVLKEASSLNKEIILDKRIDLRNKTFITIDGEDAKDFDDAIYVEKNDNGYQLYVSIADVTYYVKENSALDKEAYKRGTSIYYPGKVIPMLPFDLSDDLCSLKEKEDRYTLTCQMDIDYSGNVMTYDIYPSIICSAHRLSYNNVNKILIHDKEVIKKYEDVVPMIYSAYKLSRIINKKRREEGGIEFESNEPIIIEENDKVIDIKQRIQTESELMIEDFMIMANKTVAGHMFYLNYPLIYRNHDYPKTEKIDRFISLMAKFDYKFKGNKYQIEAKSLQKCLNSFKETTDYSLISEILLKSMSKALYSHNCLGHYGLGLDEYCHFTSPIRRYPDLIVHRMLKKYLFDQNLNDIDIDNIKNEEIAKKANEREKKATNIERQILDLKKCEYMKDKINKTFVGTIVSIVPYGFYIRLNNTIEGLVHIKNLDGYFNLDEDDNLTNGIITYKIGQAVKVKLLSVDLDNRNIDFVLV